MIRTTGSDKQNLKFDYDAMGNRVAKHVMDDAGLCVHSTYYVRDASGNVMAVYERDSGCDEGMASYALTERHIYGSSRVGMNTTHVEYLNTQNTIEEDRSSRTLGHKQYEISNHLGNVLTVVSDMKRVMDANTDGVVDGYMATIISVSDYSPFGVTLEGRSWSNDEYRFGFNGKELDKEGMGGGASTYDYGFRIYNSALAKFLSVDPLSASYPWYTPYQFAGNAPIWAIDRDGLEQAVVVRWYNQNGNCTGQTIFSITNTSDRPLGQSNFLFLNLCDTDGNKAVIKSLASRTSTAVQNTLPTTFSTFLTSNSQSSNQNTLTDFQGNPINVLDAQGALVSGIAFIRNNLCISDKSCLDEINSDITNSPNGSTDSFWIHPPMKPDIIYFDDESDVFNPLLDTGKDGTPNSLELSQAIAKLRKNPDTTAVVTGNASIEDKPGSMSNQTISASRANTVFNMILDIAKQSGINLSSRVTNAGGAGSSNAVSDPSQNSDGQESTNRNATITYDIPLQNR